MTFKVLDVWKKLLRPASKDTPSAFLHIEYSTLSQILAKEMKMAYEESSTTPEIYRDEIEVICASEVDPDRKSGSFRHEYSSPPLKDRIGAPQLIYSSYTGLVRDLFMVDFSRCSHPDESVARPILFTHVCSQISFECITISPTFTCSPIQSASLGPCLNVVPSAISMLSMVNGTDLVASATEAAEKTLATIKSVEEPVDINVTSTAASNILPAIELKPASLLKRASWISSKLAESCAISLTIGVEEPRLTLEGAKTTAHPCPLTKKARVITRDSYTRYLLEENKKMALSMLSDTPYVSPPTPPHFKTATSNPILASALPESLIALSTSTSFRNWRKAEGARVAKARIAEANDEMADVPLKFKQAHPVLAACRKQVSAYVDALENGCLHHRQ